MMKLDPARYYRMPLIMGPLFSRENPRFVYRQVQVLALQYLTDVKAIEALLPECYRPDKEPKVTVFFSYNDGVDFMAGGGYRMAAVQVAARFDGEQDHVEGDYFLVALEDQTWPIIGGREDLGVPKLYADISPVKTLPNGHLRCEASLWGHIMLGLDLEPLREQNAAARLIASRQINKRPWLAYKYIPSLDGPPDADYPTTATNDTKLERLWLGKLGNLRLGDAGIADVGPMRPILDALATLTVIRPVQAVHFQGSSILRYDLSRRLR